MNTISQAKIVRWWRRVRNASENVDLRGETIRFMCKVYTANMMCEYPTFAMKKLFPFSFNPPFNENGKMFTDYTNTGKKSDVRKWIYTNLSTSELAYVGV